MAHDVTMTVGELLLELASRVGLAAQGASVSAPLTLPTDPATQRNLRAALAAGVQRVLRFRGWSWQTPLIAVTLDATGNSPDCVQAHPGDYWIDRLATRVVSKSLVVRYAGGTGGGRVQVVSEDYLLRVRAKSSTLIGKPMLAAFGYQRPVSDGDRVRDRLVLRLFPKPDAAHEVLIRVKRDAPLLSELSERPYWPASIDEAVLAAAVEHMARYGSTVTELNVERAQTYTLQVLTELANEDRKHQAEIMGDDDVWSSGGNTPIMNHDTGTLLV
jgi:hypothetical protein